MQSIYKSLAKWWQPNQKLFIDAVEKGDLEDVIALSKLRDVDPTANNNEAIQIASKHGRLPVVKFLAGLPNVDPTANNNEALQYAGDLGYLSVVKYLVAIGAFDKGTLQYTFFPVINALLIAADAMSLDDIRALREIGKIPSETQLTTAKKDLKNEQKAYLLENGIMDICTSLNDYPLLVVMLIVDETIKYARNIPQYIKWNILERCKHTYGKYKTEKYEKAE